MYSPIVVIGRLNKPAITERARYEGQSLAFVHQEQGSSRVPLASPKQ